MTFNARRARSFFLLLLPSSCRRRRLSHLGEKKVRGNSSFSSSFSSVTFQLSGFSPPSLHLLFPPRSSTALSPPPLRQLLGVRRKEERRLLPPSVQKTRSIQFRGGGQKALAGGDSTLGFVVFLGKGRQVWLAVWVPKAVVHSIQGVELILFG